MVGENRLGWHDFDKEVEAFPDTYERCLLYTSGWIYTTVPVSGRGLPFSYPSSVAGWTVRRSPSFTMSRRLLFLKLIGASLAPLHLDFLFARERDFRSTLSPDVHDLSLIHLS